jgi:N-acetylneuraminate lyase
MKKFEGLVAAPFTPMDKNGNLILDQIPAYYRFLDKNGIAGAFINGTTGEGASLTQKEKHLNLSKWAECYREGRKVRIINLVGGTSYNECIENAIMSCEAGISAIAVIAPYFFRPAGESQLADFIARIGEAVPEMPLYFYHIPSMTGVNIPMAGFLEKISGMLSNFAGIKFTHEDLMDFTLCLNYNGGSYDILWGRDECMLSAMEAGCRGFVGSTYNYAAPLYHSIIKAFNEGDLTSASRLQLTSVEMIRLLGKYGGTGTGKAYMRYIGMDCGEYRSPVQNLTPQMYKDFVNDVKNLEMDHLFSYV